MKKKKRIIIVSLISIFIIVAFSLIIVIHNTYFGKDLFTIDDYTLLYNFTDIVEHQESIDDNIINNLNINNHYFYNPLVIVDPYGVSPLTAIIAFKTHEKTDITASLYPKEMGKMSTFYSENNDIHYIVVYGLYMDYENIIVLENNKEEVHIVKIHIEKKDYHPSLFANIEIHNNHIPINDNDFIFLSSNGNKLVSAYDQQGELRWFLSNNNYKQLTSLENGNFLLSNKEDYLGHSIEIVEVDFLGKIYNIYELEYPYLDNFSVINEDKIYYGSTNGIIVEFSLKDGKTVNTYNLKSIINEIDSNQIKEENINITSLYYDHESETILVGIDYHNTLINLSREAKLNWLLARDDLYSEKFEKYLLKPIGSYIIYPSQNHNSKIDNNILRVISREENPDNIDLISAILEYEVSNSEKTIRNLWTLRSPLDKLERGDISVRSDEKTILYSGLQGDNETSRIIVINDRGGALNMSIASSYNFAQKMAMVKEPYNFHKTKINVYNQNLENSPYKKVNYHKKFKTAEDYGMSFELSDNKLIMPHSTDDYKVILMNERGNSYVYKPIDNIIYLKKSKDNLIILLEKDNKVYNTGYYIKPLT